MKTIISFKPLKSSSKTRGIGVYTKELLENLKATFPKNQYIPTTHDYYHQQADLVHFPFFDPFFLTLPLRKSTPTVVTIHDLIPLKFPQHFSRGLRGNLKWQLQKFSVKKTNHIITDSQSSKADVQEILNISADNISVIPLAPSIDLEKIPQKLQKTITKGYSLPKRYLLYVGDINWNKNIPGLIQEFELIKDQNLHLVLVGKAFQSPSTKELKKINDLINKSKKKDLIHALGFVPSHHLPALYSLATTYIQPSFYEGFGLPILEAMKYSCPVISSNRGSLPEVAGKAALYFNPEEKGDLVEKVNKVIRYHQTRKSLIKKGRAQTQKFSWKKTAQQTNAIYEKVLER